VTKQDEEKEQEKEQEEEEEENTSQDGIAEEVAEEIVDTLEKKTEPDGEHDKQAPTDDVKKVIYGLVDACDTNLCRGGVAGIVFLVLMCLCCVGRWCCCRRRGKPTPSARYARAEVELTDADFSSYKDAPDDDDAEFGEFATNGNGRIT
jgi:hypothetical protein